LYALALIILLAQSVPDSVSGTAGWVGTGLLGAVMSWLLFVHLPGKDKQLTVLMAAKDEIAETILKQQWANFERMEIGYHNDLKMVAEHCKQELEAITRQFNHELATFREIMVVLKLFAEVQQKHFVIHEKE
jgi:hypothetical protein